MQFPILVHCAPLCHEIIFLYLMKIWTNFQKQQPQTLNQLYTLWNRKLVPYIYNNGHGHSPWAWQKATPPLYIKRMPCLSLGPNLFWNCPILFWQDHIVLDYLKAHSIVERQFCCGPKSFRHSVLTQIHFRPTKGQGKSFAEFTATNLSNSLFW